MKKRNLQLMIASIVFVVILGISFVLWTESNATNHNKPMQLSNGTVFSNPYLIKPFRLIDQNDKPFTVNDLIGHWSLIFFGFTRCPMMCPTTLGELNKAYLNLKNDGLKNNLPKIIFISVDPEHDTSAILKSYVTAFNPDFLGVSGTPTQIENLTKQLGIFYEKETPSEKTNGEIIHSGAILVINPAGKWRAILSFPHKSAVITEDVKQIISNS